MFTTLKSPTFKRFWSLWKYCWNDSKCTWRGRLSWPTRTAFVTGEDGFRGARNGTSSMVKWHFVNGKVALCRKECGTLSAKTWHFWREEQSFSAIPLILGVKSSVKPIYKGIGGMRGMRLIPLMPPIPLCIGFTEDFHPQNEGDSRKTPLCSLKRHIFADKVPYFLRQSTTLPLTKCHFTIDKVPFRDPRKPSSPVTKAVLAGCESRPRQKKTLHFPSF